MPIPVSTLKAEGHSRIRPHTDFGLCTILFQDEVGGLEVDPFHTGEFLPATPIPGTCVINVADLLQRLSNDRLRSTKHRVRGPPLTPEALAKLGPDGSFPARYSIPFFVHPSADTVVAPILEASEQESKYEPVVAGEWRAGITARNYGLAVPAS